MSANKNILSSISIADVLKAGSTIAPKDSTKVTFDESTFELDLTHPAFNRESFVQDAGTYGFMMQGTRIMFGKVSSLETGDAQVYDIAYNMSDAWKRQESAITAYKDVVTRPDDYVVGLHKAGKEWLVSADYSGDITDLTPDQDSIEMLLAQVERLPNDGEFYFVHKIASINGSLPVLRVSDKPLRESGNGAYRTYAHQAIDHLLCGNIITFSWKEDHSLNKKLAIILGSVQAVIDGDEELQAIYRQHYASAIVRKQANRAAAREIAQTKAANETVDYSDIVVMDKVSGNEIVVNSLDACVLAFVDDTGRVKTTLRFNPENVYDLGTVQRLASKGWEVQRIG